MGEVGSVPRPEWEDACCTVCPAQVVGAGAFDVVARPDRRYPYDRDRGYRIDVETGCATCVHPHRIGVPPGCYASAGVPFPGPVATVFTPSPEQLELPEMVIDLEGWLVAMLRTAVPEQMASALEEAEAIAATRFAATDIVTALRRVLAYELADH